MFCRVLQDDLDLAHTVDDYLIGRFRNKISKKDKDANSFIDQDNFQNLNVELLNCHGLVEPIHHLQVCYLLLIYPNDLRGDRKTG